MMPRVIRLDLYKQALWVRGVRVGMCLCTLPTDLPAIYAELYKQWLMNGDSDEQRPPAPTVQRAII